VLQVHIEVFFKGLANPFCYR